MTDNNTKTFTTKNKVLKVLFYLTFIPYIFAIGLVMWGGIFGLNFFGIQNGLEGINTALLYILLFMVIIPIIPICLIIQISTLIRKLSKKNVSLKKHFLITAVIGIVTLASMYLIILGNSILEEMPWLRSEIQYIKSEEIVHYDLDNDVECYGKKRFRNATMMADWDKNTIGFLYYDVIERYREYELKPMSDEEFNEYSTNFSHFEQQTQYTFDNGSVLITYTDMHNDSNASTVLITVTTPSGERLAAKCYLGEYLNLQNGDFQK